MPDEILVDLTAQDAQFIASTKAASSAMAALAAQEEKLGKVAASSGLDQKKFSQTFKQIESKRVAEEARALKLKVANEKKAAQNIERDAQKRQRTENKIARLLIGRRGVIIGEVTGLGNAGVAAIEFGAALATAGVAALALLATIGVFAIKMAEAKTEATGVLDTLTNGRGAQALKLIDGLADDLGIKFQEARDEFIKFRQAGLDNAQSANLIKLRADAIAAGKGAAEADEAVSKVLSYKGGRGTAAELAEMAKEMGVVGDGSTSARAKFNSLNGALNRIDNDKVKILEEIGEKIGPSVDRAAQAMAKLADSLLNTKEGKALIDDIAKSISAIADAATKAAPIVADFIASGKAHGVYSSWVSEAYDAVAEVVSAFAEIPTAFIDVGEDINTAVNYIGGGVEDAFIDVSQTIWRGLKAIPAGVEDIGGAVVDGILAGIKSAGPRLFAAVEGVGSDIKKKFKDILGIHSPSVVFKGYGLNIGAGLNRGLDRSMPDGGDMARRMLPEPAQLNHSIQNTIQPQQAPIFGPRNAPAPSPHLTIIIQGGATEEDEAKARRAFERWWRGVQQQQGAL